MPRQRVTRREFLHTAAMGVAGAALIGGDAQAQMATRPAAPSTPGKLGQSLIGKLEGPEIIRDTAKFPRAFKEAS